MSLSAKEEPTKLSRELDLVLVDILVGTFLETFVQQRSLLIPPSSSSLGSFSSLLSESHLSSPLSTPVHISGHSSVRSTNNPTFETAITNHTNPISTTRPELDVQSLSQAASTFTTTPLLRPILYDRLLSSLSHSTPVATSFSPCLDECPISPLTRI